MQPMKLAICNLQIVQSVSACVREGFQSAMAQSDRTQRAGQAPEPRKTHDLLDR